MKKKQMKEMLLLASLLVGGFLVTGCTNKDYDFKQIDATMGFGGNELVLPSSETMAIPLDDILKLENDGCVVVDAARDSNYYFHQDGEAIEPVHPRIDKIVITEDLSQTSDIVLSLASAAKGTRAANATLRGEGDIYTFEYSGNKPSEVVSLSHADVDCNLSLSVNLTALSSWTQQLDKVEITFPSYMEIESSKGTLSNNVLTLNNLSTAEICKLTIRIKGLDFTKGGTDGLVVNDKVKMKGAIHMAVQASNITQGTGTSAKISNSLQMGSVTVLSATGKFNPTIDLNKLGKTTINGIPEFLQGGNVKVDLYNPIIKLVVSNDMDIEGKLDGVLKSFKGGSQIAAVDVNDITIGANQTTTVYICRRNEGIPTGDGVVVKVVPNLSTIIETIPDEITFDAHAAANKDKEGTFLFGHSYTVAPSYSVDAPIAFAENAVIEYSDDFDGWNDDIKDLELSDGAYLSLTANAQNKVPATLIVEATPLGVDGEDISNLVVVDIKQGTVKASTDGTTAVASPLEIEIREKVKGGLKKLDGLSYKVLGKASHDGTSVTGVTLNAKKHTLKLENIKIKLVGKVIGNFN